MAYFRLNAYDADVFIPEFKGLNQAYEIASDLRFAIETENVETKRGVLQPMAAPDILDYTFDSRIETLAGFHRRWYTGTGSKDWMVVAAGGKIYCKQSSSTGDWTELPKPESLTVRAVAAGEKLSFGVKVDRDAYRTKVSATSGTTTFTYTVVEETGSWSADPSQYGITVKGNPQNGDQITAVYVSASGATAYSCNVWSWATYEINPDGVSAPVDVLLMSNAQDGMIMVIPEYASSGVHADWMVYAVDTLDKKFGVIERYAERIWGGAIPEDPDMLMYSRPFDPLDWTATWEGEQPEDGAGDVSQPSWDGDSFTALKTFGSQLIAFKKTRVWRILGTDPGEYTFKEQYGGGAPYANTIAVDTERILMVEKEGMSIYDGLAVNEFNRPMIELLWNKVNKDAMDQMCAVLFKNRYYLAVPTGTSTVNNALIVYNMEEGSFLYYTDIFIESMMPTFETLYATSSSLPGKIMVINYDSWVTEKASGKNTKWMTPWMDFSRMSIAKGGYEIYIAPEVRKYPVTFRFSIQTEKKTKTKTVVVHPTTEKVKQKRIRFGGVSRRFRLIIETVSLPQEATWRLLGGIQMVVEIDPD